jgi:hypothetical protein
MVNELIMMALFTTTIDPPVLSVIVTAQRAPPGCRREAGARGPDQPFKFQSLLVVHANDIIN